MTEHIQNLLDFFVVQKAHHRFRKPKIDPYELAAGMQSLTPMQRAAKRLRFVLKKETPVVFPSEKIAMIRTVSNIPEIFTEQEMAALRAMHFVPERGKVFNLCPWYSALVDTGTEAKRMEVEMAIARYKADDNAEAVELLEAMLAMLGMVEALAEKYRREALRVGNAVVAETFARVPRHKPRTLLEAFQFFRLVHFVLWCCGHYHNTLGRLDQYMLPYYEQDIAEGRLCRERALELVEEFFISFNKDNDLYPGMQQGDNGQSLMLGGTGPDGRDQYNELSALCMQASLELKLIDPKINLRINKNTPMDRYVQSTLLTRQGLGFPQYANDDIVFEALKRWGYEEEDACNYTVAACWEFIIPNMGMDIPNIGALSFADAVVRALPRLPGCASFALFLDQVKQALFLLAHETCAEFQNVYMEPAPFMSLLIQGCLENGRDVSSGGKYNNYGIHGVGVSTAADSLAAIQKYVYEEKSVDAQTLLDALAVDFDGYEELLPRLRYDAPKMGNNDPRADDMAVLLLGWFADALSQERNDRGGVFRPGTGSATHYIKKSRALQATPDGRRKGEAFGCNYSPSLFARPRGPLSVMRSFTRPDLTRVANGGPLTMELHDTVFRNADSVSKIAAFVKLFFDMGGHQLQINAVNRERMLDAKANPGEHRGLIVRVWGWSGYFVELDEVYQDHIIQRAELADV